MANEPAQLLATHLRKLSAAVRVDGLPDRELVRRFAARRDEEAFAALVRRHGPMVLRACRRVLHDPHLAEDVFQATFLVLSRKAASLCRAESVGSWLYGVAYRLSLKMRGQIARQHRQESRAVIARRVEDPLAELSVREAQLILGEELGCLPEKYRAPLVLCYLEGQTRDEAARSLGWPVGLVKSRLEQGRERLRQRLKRRGLSLSAALIATLLADPIALAALSPILIRNTLRIAVGLPSAAPAQVAALAEGTMKSMGMAKCKLGVSLFVLMGALTAGAGVLAYPQSTVQPKQTPSAEKAMARPRREAKAPPRTDFYGDPLPPEAVRRIGSIHFRQGGDINELIAAPDGKTLFSCTYGSDRKVCVWESATGRLLRRLPGDFRYTHMALSANGTILAVGGLGGIGVWEPASGRELHRFEGDKYDSFCGLGLSADGTMVVSSDPTDIHLWDAATGAEIARLKWPIQCSGNAFLAFTPDGKTLIAEHIIDPRVHRWDVASRRPLEPIQVADGNFSRREGRLIRMMALSQDGRSLAVVCSGFKIQENVQVSIWDVTSGKRRLLLDGEKAPSAALAISPDGKRLAVGGRIYQGDKSVRLWDLTTGKRLYRLEDDADALAFSPDGKTLFTGSSLIRRWDVESGKEIQPPSGPRRQLQSFVLSPDGRLLACATYEDVRVWEPATGKLLHHLAPAAEWVAGCAFSPNSKTLAVIGADGTIHLWDAEARKEGRVLRTGQRLSAVAFAPDGQTLLTSSAEATVCLWDVPSGKEVRRIIGKDIWRTKRQPLSAESVASSPSGRLVFAAAKTPEGTVVGAWDVSRGVEAPQVTAEMNARMARIGVNYFHHNNPARLALSADGRMLTVNREKSISVWEIASGKERLRLQGQEEATLCTAFSPDGRLFASACEFSTLRLWDLATGTQLRQLSGHRGKVNALAFSPDGRLLYSGGDDTSVLVWDVGQLVGRGLPALPRLDALTAWDDLASGDAARGYRAIHALRADPATALPLLKKHLRPAAPVDDKRLAELIRNLDANEFSVRDSAFCELEKLGEVAETTLRQALRGSPALEVRRRIEELLEKLVCLTGDNLRSLRGVEVLEHIGTSDARRVLQTLAEGSPEARLTREARAALDRLARRR